MKKEFAGKLRPRYCSITKIRKMGTELIKKHPKVTSIAVLLCANVFNNLVTFIVNVFLARTFGPENFGIFSLAVSIMMIFHLVANLGLTLTMIRFYNLYEKDVQQQKLLLSSFLILRFFIISLLVGIASPCAILLIKLLKVSDSYALLFSLSIMTSGVLSLWVYLQNFMQAYKRFSRLAIYIIIYGTFRIICFTLLYFICNKQFNLIAVLGSLYSAPALIVACIGIIPIIINLFPSGLPAFSDIMKTIRRAIRYSKWVAISGISYNLVLRSIQFILAIRTSKLELGIFSAGFVFTVAFSTLNVAVRSVFFPHVTALDKTQDMKSHFKKIKKLFPYYLIFMIISIAFLAVIQIVFLGDEYATALPVFLITSVALALTIFMGLISMLIHTLMHPEIDAFVNIGRLVTAGVLVYLFAPNFGAIGGAIAYTLPIVLGELFMVLFVRRTIHEKAQV